MSGHKNFNKLRRQVLDRPGADERLAEHRREIDRALTLGELRKARELTQTQLATALGLNQSGVSRIEHQTDVFLSTLRTYVEALGGRLELSAIFDDGIVPITTLEELAEPVLA